MASPYGGSLDVLQVTDYIRNLFREKAAKKGLERNPQLVGAEGPSAGPVDPKLFANPFFVEALRQRSGLDTAETARGFQRTQTTGLQQAIEQDKADAERLGGVSVPAFGAITTRQENRAQEPIRERTVGVAETQAQTEKEKLGLLKQQIENEAVMKLVENIMPLAQMVGGKDFANFGMEVISNLPTGGPFGAVTKAAASQAARKKALMDSIGAPGGATTAPGTAAPPSVGNVFQNPQFQQAETRFREANKIPTGTTQTVQFGGPTGARPAPIPVYNLPPKLTSPGQVTTASSNIMSQIQGLLQKRGDIPQSPEAEKKFAREQARLPQLTSDYQTFVEAARALGVTDLEQLNKFMAMLVESGHLKAR